MKIAPFSTHDTKCCGCALIRRFIVSSHGFAISKDPPTYFNSIGSVTYGNRPVEAYTSPNTTFPPDLALTDYWIWNSTTADLASGKNLPHWDADVREARFSSRGIALGAAAMRAAAEGRSRRQEADGRRQAAGGRRQTGGGGSFVIRHLTF